MYRGFISKTGHLQKVNGEDNARH